MKKIIGLVGIIVFLASVFELQARPTMRKWEFVQPSDLEIKFAPESEEIFSGGVATFTLTVRNRTDKPVRIDFKTGQRYDMAVFHDNVQIWRWGQGTYLPPLPRLSNYYPTFENRKIIGLYDKNNVKKTWDDTSNSIEIPVGKKETFQMNWVAVDRQGAPLPQGLYRAHGMIMAVPRHLVSNTADIHLLPPIAVNKGEVKVSLNQTFQIEFPQQINGTEVFWKVQYVYNDNRVKEIFQRVVDKKVIKFFRAERRGHVVIHFFGYNMFKMPSEAYERRTYRIQIEEKEPLK